MEDCVFIVVDKQVMFDVSQLHSESNYNTNKSNSYETYLCKLLLLHSFQNCVDMTSHQITN